MPKIIDQVAVRPPGNYSKTLAPEVQYNYGFRGIVVTTNVTNANSGSFVVAVVAVDANNIDRTIVTQTYSTNGLKVIRVLPTLTTSGGDAQDEIPKAFRVDVTHSTATVITYSCAYSMLV